MQRAYIYLSSRWMSTSSSKLQDSKYKEKTQILPFNVCIIKPSCFFNYTEGFFHVRFF